ncbi:MAG: SRPBCC family protein [Acidimicrobiia bacterium]|nr:SRPBCC family protein [Acidimicrobiia bacterium]
MPLATFRHSATSNAAAPDIWDALQTADAWGGMSLIDSVSEEAHDEAGRLVSFRFTTTAGGRTWEGTARNVSSVPGEHMDLTLNTKEIRGRMGIELAPEGGQTTVAVRLEVEPAGMLATLFWGVVREAITTGFNRQVEEFAASFGA